MGSAYEKPTALAGAASAALAVLASGVTGAPSASSVPTASRGEVVYDALGDSYASGYGVPPYDGSCGRSESAYAERLNGRIRVHLDDFVACATTTTLVAGGQLNALDAQTDLVTLTIGGNDIGWSSAVVTCLAGTDPECAAEVAATRLRISTALPALLDTVNAQVAQHAPNARAWSPATRACSPPTTAATSVPRPQSTEPSTAVRTCSTGSSPGRPESTASPSSTSRADS